MSILIASIACVCCAHATTSEPAQIYRFRILCIRGDTGYSIYDERFKSTAVAGQAHYAEVVDTFHTVWPGAKCTVDMNEDLN